MSLYFTWNMAAYRQFSTPDMMLGSWIALDSCIFGHLILASFDIWHFRQLTLEILRHHSQLDQFKQLSLSDNCHRHLWQLSLQIFASLDNWQLRHDTTLLTVVTWKAVTWTDTLDAFDTLYITFDTLWILFTRDNLDIWVRHSCHLGSCQLDIITDGCHLTLNVSPL